MAKKKQETTGVEKRPCPNPDGRPVMAKYKINHMIDRTNEYTQSRPVPIIKELCYLEDWNYTTLCEKAANHPTLRHALDRLIYKKEAALELGALSGKLNASQARFSLHQLGWKSKQEIVVEQRDTENLQPLADMLNGIARGDDCE